MLPKNPRYGCCTVKEDLDHLSHYSALLMLEKAKTGSFWFGCVRDNNSAFWTEKALHE